MELHERGPLRDTGVAEDHRVHRIHGPTRLLHLRVGPTNGPKPLLTELGEVEEDEEEVEESRVPSQSEVQLHGKSLLLKQTSPLDTSPTPVVETGKGLRG